MTPQELAETLKLFNENGIGARALIGRLRKSIGPVDIPGNLVPAKDEDLQEGAIIWHEREIIAGGPFWNIVIKRRFANDPYKAYYADDGNSYGLDGAFVEVSE